ncbi:hypothetical protein C8J56DRAFT_444915 [Mycena floridula]|nr:hypothetical protein C8J56DRAFT_444915 [Mycena floridula]
MSVMADPAVLDSSPVRPRPPKSTTSSTVDEEQTAWGSNFWVTLVDPMTQTSFFACPATGQVSWDPPAGNFVLPPSADGEWWELADESRGGLPYYYHTKTGETVWERPSTFVIPLGILQNTALGRRLSNRFSKTIPEASPAAKTSPGSARKPGIRRSYTTDSHHPGSRSVSQQLPPIPGSPYVTDGSAPPSPTSQTAPLTPVSKGSPVGKSSPHSLSSPESSPRARSKSSSYVSHRPAQPQSLTAALEILTSASQSESGHTSTQPSESSSRPHITISVPSTPTQSKLKRDIPPSPRRPIPATPDGTRKRNVSAPMVSGKQISGPILNHAATLNMSPVKHRNLSPPIPVEPRRSLNGASKVSGTHPALPHDLASDIQLFSESDYARQYFSTHRIGFIFRRRVPVAQMMTWQKAPLSSPLLTLNRSLIKDAVKMFKVIQHIMGDRERDKAVGVRIASDTHISIVASINSPTPSLHAQSTGILDEERWLLGEGLTHGELRDEIYCQVMKQLSGNPNTESIFKGWQLLCVLLITFPPSKNFETYLRAFIQNHMSQQEGRVDVMAKYSLRRLSYIARKGPRGKPPTLAEIETASDAAFNPSTFGETLDGIIRLQERNYPQQKVPIILPFLADGILALGGTKAEGIFRVPGDGDSVSELKLRIDRGYYTLDGVDDPHILASLMKLWLRELCDPLVPEEMYNECITSSKDSDACVRIIERLPTINRRVVLFVISFLQLFLEERTQSVTKMTPANLALVMAPNLLRCNSDSMSVVFTNAQYEQIFVYNLLLHLKCGEVDANYTPAHGLGAVQTSPAPRMSKSKSRSHR